MPKQVRIYADVIFDLFHRGHVEFLKKISALEKNSYIMVGTYSDDVVESYKRKPIFCMEDRIEIMKACKYIDEVIPNSPFLITKEFLELHQIDYVAHGNDMLDYIKKYNYPVPIEMGIMRIVPRWEGISTTKIIEEIKKRGK